MGNGIKGVGCDIVSIPRISELIKQPRFLNKVYTAYEQDYIKDRSVYTAAGIWAAKEAVSKALGTGFSGFSVKDVEVRHSANGVPCVVLHNGAEKLSSKLCIERIHISISHEDNYAMAFAIAE